MNIFTVTTMPELKQRGDHPYTRTWGWFPDLEKAIQCVLGNHGDIYDLTYGLALIQEVPCGLYPRVAGEHWFEWRDDRYQPCDKPERMKRVVNFALG